MACCILHNIMIKEEGLNYSKSTLDIFREEQTTQHLISIEPTKSTNATDEAKRIGDEFMRYFNNEEAVNFQWEAITKK